MFLPCFCRSFACPLFTLVLFALALPAAEPVSSRTVTVEECLERVAASRLELRAGAFRTEAAASRAKQASRRLNPRLETEIENVAGTDGMEGLRAAESTFSLAQEVELGHKRQRRTATAEAETAVRRAEEDVLRHALMAETRRAALAVLTAQEKTRLAEEVLALVRETEGVALAREQAGKTTSLETERARSETAQAALAVQERLSEQQQAVRELALCWGETEPAFDAVAGSLDDPPVALPDRDALLLQAARHPARLAAEAHVRALEAQIRSEEAARFPNLDVSAGVRRFEESDGFGFVAGVGIELPVMNRNRDAVHAAEADAEAARLEAAAAWLKREGDVRRLYARLKALADKESRLQTAVLPPCERVLALVRQAHEQGKAGYLDVLEARRALTEARRGLIDVRTDYRACRIDLDECVSTLDMKPVKSE